MTMIARHPVYGDRRLGAPDDDIGMVAGGEAMPPHARTRSPCVRSFIAGGHGEWSETRRST